MRKFKHGEEVVLVKSPSSSEAQAIRKGAIGKIVVEPDSRPTDSTVLVRFNTRRAFKNPSAGHGYCDLEWYVEKDNIRRTIR